MVCGRLALTIRKKWILSRKGNGYRCPPELVEALNVRQQEPVTIRNWPSLPLSGKSGGSPEERREHVNEFAGPYVSSMPWRARHFAVSSSGPVGNLTLPQRVPLHIILSRPQPFELTFCAGFCFLEAWTSGKKVRASTAWISWSQGVTLPPSGSQSDLAAANP